jgi:hypothetical protein
MEPVSWRPGFAPPATPLTRPLLVYFRSGAYIYRASGAASSPFERDISTRFKGTTLSIILPRIDGVACDNRVFFFIGGEANVLVNDRFVGARTQGTFIGEMAAIDASARRSATIRAKTDVLTLKIAEPRFREALDGHPKTYKALATLLAYRLRQRSQFHQPPNVQPALFIGCSTKHCRLPTRFSLD